MGETISPDTTIAQYRVISKIGEGGMGEVYRARDGGESSGQNLNRKRRGLVWCH